MKSFKRHKLAAAQNNCAMKTAYFKKLDFFNFVGCARLKLNI